MSTFNPEQFLAGTTTEAHETKITNVPDGVYSGQIAKIDFRTLPAKDTTPERTIMELTWNVLDESAKKVTGLAQPTVRQSIWLDLTPTGSLETGPGKNVSLGQLREALGQNKPGKAWAPAHLNGGTAKVQVKGKLNSSDGQIYAQVTKVSK